MGCEGYVSLAKIGEGGYKLRQEKQPVFDVVEPIAIIPVFRNRFGDNHYNLTTFCDTIDYAFEFGDKNYRFIPFAGRGMVIFPKECLKHHKFTNYCHNEESWDKITLGTWVVDNYYESGTKDDLSFSLPKYPEVEIKEFVSFMLWT